VINLNFEENFLKVFFTKKLQKPVITEKKASELLKLAIVGILAYDFVC